MLLYTNLREQLDEQFPSLASRARQTLAKTCDPNADLWSASRSTRSVQKPQPNCFDVKSVASINLSGLCQPNEKRIDHHIYQQPVPRCL